VFISEAIQRVMQQRHGTSSAWSCPWASN